MKIKSPRVVKLNAIASAMATAERSVALATADIHAKGVVLWEGISRLDGKTPIVVIGTFQSANGKTGALAQVWVLLRDVAPHEAVKSGADRAVCWDCRYANGRGCYVQVWEAPLSIWKAFHRGLYPAMTAVEFAQVAGDTRLGAWGEMTAAPYSLTLDLCSGPGDVLGYSHQWNNGMVDPAFSRYLMASVDSPTEAAAAWVKGWRTFRVAENATEERLPGESICPFELNGLQCAACMACDGAQSGKRGSVVVSAHGKPGTVRKVIQILRDIR
jgi:hypothetical protein